MRITLFFILLNFLFFFSCKNKSWHLTKIEANQITVSDSLLKKSEVEDFIEPYRTHIKKDLDSVLAYSVKTYAKTNGTFNTAIGNYMVDIIFDEANPVFKKRTGKNIDMVLLNYGGIRSNLPQGNITASHAYELMPFENSIVVVPLKGTTIFKMINYLIQSKQAHPISKLQLVINKNYELVKAEINNEAINPEKKYYVATSDYLHHGGDHMDFFKESDTVFNLNYKIRSIILDNFKKIDTIQPVIDNRFIQINN
ncbi:5'-nucleotidase C-terminal domain-containing protein [Tamlana fucoidanivorans]|uniref:5'-Nucleotidase C-terminal domain-containing protein n=1 Tax=Allotamlana fucoidanivorans TaxID=2583814 RepID=A0A5C4SJ30_9FLAO|nr:5'-nucleotidase [Tamlana fucoidanivorans]TNJ43104.1 hypothetical protein FGF67_12135 [Tamlana fucoidanivorans]